MPTAEKKPRFFYPSLLFFPSRPALVSRHCGNRDGNKKIHVALCGSNCLAPGMRRRKFCMASRERLAIASNRTASSLSNSGGKAFVRRNTRTYGFVQSASEDAIGLCAMRLRSSATSKSSPNKALRSEVSNSFLRNNFRSSRMRLLDCAFVRHHHRALFEGVNMFSRRQFIGSAPIISALPLSTIGRFIWAAEDTRPDRRIFISLNY